MVKSLDKKWKEFLFAFAGFGPNLLMVLMGGYFTDALNPVAFAGTETYQAIMSGTCFILPALFPILYTIGKIFDGVIDVPFAHITDTLSTRWGRRRPAILVSAIPMIISFAFCWWPIAGYGTEQAQLINTIWICFWAIVFFAAYTMCLIAFYGSLSTTCCDEPQRLRVSGYKSFFDTISYCLVYALVPVLLDALKLPIDKFVFILLPLMLTIFIPVFMIKEGEKYGYPEDQGLQPEKIKFFESIKISFKNRPFMVWMAINCCTFFGLQMFLSSMNTMIIGGMGFNGLEMALVNTCAFAPVPVMLYLFNKLKARKGLRFTYQTCLLAFAVAILSFFFASTFLVGTENKPLQYVIGCLGGVIGSWAIGSFFMVPYLIPTQISAVEEKLMGKNHSAMYFAIQALLTSIVGALAGSLVYDNIKNLWISKGASGVQYATSIEDATTLFGVAESSVFNLGTLLIPFIVTVVCVAGFVIAFKMPKDYSHKIVAREFKKIDPSLDITEFENEPDPIPEKSEIMFVQIGLSVLSGFIFGFIWSAYTYRSIKELTTRKNSKLYWLLSCLVPFGSIYYAVKANNELKKVMAEKGLTHKGHNALIIASGIIFPILPVNLVSLIIMQRNLNKIYKQEEDALKRLQEQAVKQ